MHLFYSEDIGVHATLKNDEAKHCTLVLRHKEGHQIQVFDGKGYICICEITKIDKHEVQCKIISKAEISKKFHHSIAICPPKNNARLEWFIEKAVEVGINEIFLLQSERSEKVFSKLDRIHKIIISASKQSGNLLFPKIVQVEHPTKLIQMTTHYNARFLAHCVDASIALKKTEISQNGLCVIGPEGDFTSGEIQLFEKYGFTSVNLGEPRLRTETAGLVALTLMNYR